MIQTTGISVTFVDVDPETGQPSVRLAISTPEAGLLASLGLDLETAQWLGVQLIAKVQSPQSDLGLPPPM